MNSVINYDSERYNTVIIHDNYPSKVKVPMDHEELSFFDRHWDNGIDWYLNNLPKVAEDEIVFEKTPKYFVYPPSLDRIAATIPGMNQN